MQSSAKTVREYLESLPEDRRTIIEQVRKVILANLDKKIEERMDYGIGYYIPLKVYPDGYHCTPGQPLPYAGIASQKQYVSIHVMCLYSSSPAAKWFENEWKATGRKLNMGKCCIRVKKIEDVALDVIGKLFKEITAKKYIEVYETGLKKMKSKPKKK